MTDISLQRHVDAPPAEVFAFFTSSEKWSMWQGRATTIDARVGGEYRMVAPNNGVARGEVIELVPDRRIVFTWGWEGHPTVPPGSTTVTIELTPTGGSTLVSLVHSGLPEDETGLHRSGWAHYLTRLLAIATGVEVGPDPGLG